MLNNSMFPFGKLIKTDLEPLLGKILELIVHNVYPPACLGMRVRTTQSRIHATVVVLQGCRSQRIATTPSPRIKLTNGLKPFPRDVASIKQEALFRALIFLILGVITLFTIQSIHKEEWSFSLCVDDFFNQLFGVSVVQLLTKLVTGLPVLCVFGRDSGFNSPSKLA